MRKNLYFALFFVLLSFAAAAQTIKVFELPKLNYPKNSLAPVISEQTIDYHYGKHLQGYINNLNNLKKGTQYDTMPLDEIVKKSSGALFNNAAQTWNHIFYFDTFMPEAKATKVPSGELLKAINKKWGSLDKFKAEFDAAGASVFGSGWVWLVKDNNGNLSIVTTQNGNNPVTQGLTPLLAADVWEHSYYLDYQNRRADHLKELWKIVDWKKVDSRY